MIDGVLEAIPFHNDGDLGPRDCGDGWLFPSEFDARNVIFAQEFGSEHFLIVSLKVGGHGAIPHTRATDRWSSSRRAS